MVDERVVFGDAVKRTQIYVSSLEYIHIIACVSVGNLAADVYTCTHLYIGTHIVEELGEGEGCGGKGGGGLLLHACIKLFYFHYIYVCVCCSSR